MCSWNEHPKQRICQTLMMRRYQKRGGGGAWSVVLSPAKTWVWLVHRGSCIYRPLTGGTETNFAGGFPGCAGSISNSASCLGMSCLFDLRGREQGARGSWLACTRQREGAKWNYLRFLHFSRRNWWFLMVPMQWEGPCVIRNSICREAFYLIRKGRKGTPPMWSMSDW